MKRSKKAQTGGSAKKKSKLDALFDKLETSNSMFLAAHQSAAVELAKAQQQQQQRQQQQISPALKLSVQGTSPVVDRKELVRREQRRDRFLNEQQGGGGGGGGSSPVKKASKTLVEAKTVLLNTQTNNRTPPDATVVHGQNTNLEKEYFRLTSHPCIADVRPPAVLTQALDLIKHKWRQGCSYKHACEQLKSIRQDLIVQHVRDALTVAVYETHARIALEVKDWGELRQSLAVLCQLYAEIGCLNGTEEIDDESTKKKKKDKKTKKKDDVIESATSGLENQSEFVAANLMLAAATGRSVLAHELKESFSRGFLQNVQSDVFLKHALAACRAAGASHFVGLLRLYPDAPRMSPYLLDLLVERTRPTAWSALIAAMSPQTATTRTTMTATTAAGGGGEGDFCVEDVAAWLGFETCREARDWMLERGGVVVPGSTSDVVDVKASREGLRLYLAAN